MQIDQALADIYHRLQHIEHISKRATIFALRELQSDVGDSLSLRSRVHYLRRGFSSKTVAYYDFDGNASDYLPSNTWKTTGDIAGDLRTVERNKHIFYELLNPHFSEYTPDVFGVIDAGVVHERNGGENHENVDRWLKQLAETEGTLLAKPTEGSGGTDVYLIQHTNDGIRVNGERAEHDLASVFSRGIFLVSEYVEQADYAEAIFPDAANTIRVITLQDVDTREPFIAQAIHRFGVNDSAPVDNWDKGGLSAGIDLEEGVITSVGEKYDAGVKWIDAHPDTNEQISGVQIPEWDKIRVLSLDLARHFWYLPLVAWDFIVTEDGPVVIEGNCHPTIPMMQIHEPLLTDERTRKFFEYHDIIDPS